jgi:quinol monooxygenase YgiN
MIDNPATADGVRTGFAVVYRWRLHPGREEAFGEAWEAVTLALRERRGARGSRLHRAEDGTWVAYAQWPSREAWDAVRADAPLVPAAATVMTDAVAEAFPPLALEPLRDHLLPG